MLRRIAWLVSVLTVPEVTKARSVAGFGLPSEVCAPGPGWKGCNPLGVSAVTLKCPVNGGPMFEGRVSGSI